MDFWETVEAKRELQPDIDDESGHVCIQWKGTKVCMDFTCACGRDGHICGEDFAYQVQCPCGRLWLMPETLQLVELTGEVKAGTIRHMPSSIKTPQDDDP